MKNNNYELKIKVDGIKVVDINTNSLKELEKSFKFAKQKFK